MSAHFRAVSASHACIYMCIYMNNHIYRNMYMYVHNYKLYNYNIHYYYNCGKAHLGCWSRGLVSGVGTALAAVCGNLYFYMHLYGHFSGPHVLACTCYCIIFPEPLPLWCHCPIDPTTSQIHVIWVSIPSHSVCLFRFTL